MSAHPSTFDLFSADTLRNPGDFYRALHQHAPVYQIPDTDIYVISGYDDIRKALKQTEIYSNDITTLLNVAGPSSEVGAVLKNGWRPANTLLTMDPPEHRKYRNLLNKVFSAARVEKMHGYMEQITDELIDSFITNGGCEFVSAFAVPLPVNVIADQLGVPRSDVGLFKQWSDATTAQLGRFTENPEEDLKNAQLIVDFQHYFVDIIEQRRQQPHDDIISDLVNIRLDDGRELTTEELLSLLQQLLVAGNETTTSSLAGGLWQLLENPEQLALLQREPAHIDNAVEEFLRLESPTAGMWRLVKQDTQFNGVDIPKGAKVMLRFAAANLDPSQFKHPCQLDVTRTNASSHLAFGQGVHFCLGAMLARKEMKVAFARLLPRLQNLRLCADNPPPIYFPNLLLRGPERLHIRFEPRV